jgi:hypothetical protein
LLSVKTLRTIRSLFGKGAKARNKTIFGDVRLSREDGLRAVLSY